MYLAMAIAIGGRVRGMVRRRKSSGALSPHPPAPFSNGLRTRRGWVSGGSSERPGAPMGAEISGAEGGEATQRAGPTRPVPLCFAANGVDRRIPPYPLPSPPLPFPTRPAQSLSPAGTGSMSRCDPPHVKLAVLV